MDCVITGHIGRKATAVLKGAGVKICLSATGSVQSTIEAFLAGRCEEEN